jgi:hypothetical protein
MCVHDYSCFYIIFILFYRVTIFILCIFGSIVIRTTYTRTDPISFISAPSSLHFFSKSAIKYNHFRICIQSLSTSLRIRQKNVVKDMIKAKSDPIRLHTYDFYRPMRVARRAARTLDGPITRMRSPHLSTVRDDSCRPVRRINSRRMIRSAESSLFLTSR